MKLTTALIAAGSCAAGFAIAALTRAAPSHKAPATAGASGASKSAATAAPAAPPSAAVLATIAADMARDPGPVSAARDWARRDPDAFVHWLRHSDPQPSKETLDVFFDTWRKRDARAALLAACELPDRFGLRHSFLINLGFPGLFTSQPDVALDVLAVIEARYAPQSQSGLQIFGTIAPGTLEALHPAAVAERLRRAPGSQTGQEFCRCYARYLNEKSQESALAWTASLPFSLAAPAYEEILRSTARTAPLAALEIMARLPSGHVQALQGDNGLIQELARQAPGETIRWLQEHVGIVPQSSELPLTHEWLRQDREAATEWLLTGGNPEDRERRLSTAAGSAAQALGTGAALAWAEGLPEDFRDAALSGVVSSPGMNNLPAVLNYLAPQADGSLTPSQLSVVKSLALRAKQLPADSYAALLEWSRSPANVSGAAFDR